MIQAKCIQKFRDKNNHIYGYRLVDINGQTQDVQSNNLKQAIAAGQIHIVNLTLTKDGRLVDTTEHHLQSKQLGPDPKLQLSNSSHQKTTDSRTLKEHNKESKIGNKQNISYYKALLSINKMIHKAVSEYDRLFNDKSYYHLKDISKDGEALGIRPYGKLDDGNIHLVYLSAPIFCNTYIGLLESYDSKTIKYYIANAYNIDGFEFDWVDLHEEKELGVNAESEHIIHTYASEDTIKAEIKNVVHAFINAVTEYFKGAVQYTVKKYNELDNNHTWKIGNNARILIDDNVRIKVLEDKLDGDLEEDMAPVEFTVNIDKDTNVKFTSDMYEGVEPKMVISYVHNTLEILVNSNSLIHKFLKGTSNFNIISTYTKQINKYLGYKDADFKDYIEETIYNTAFDGDDCKKYCANITYLIILSNKNLDRDIQILEEPYDEYIITDRYIIKTHQGDKETFIEDFGGYTGRNTFVKSE